MNEEASHLSNIITLFLLAHLDQHQVGTVVSGFLVPIAHCTLPSLTCVKYLNHGGSRELKWQLARESPQFNTGEAITGCCK